MRNFKLGTLVVAATALSIAPAAYAQGRGGGHAPTVHGNPHTTSAPTTTSTSSGTTTTSGSTSGTTSTSGSTSTSAPAPLNPIAAKIMSHPQLASRLNLMLPQGMSLNQASSGFRNQGQFIAALHVSRNLNIPFTQLKDTMLGITTTTSPSTPSTLGTSTSSSSTTTTSTSSPMSLGQAIHTLRPSADSTAQANLATSQASTDLKTSTTTTSSK